MSMVNDAKNLIKFFPEFFSASVKDVNDLFKKMRDVIEFGNAYIFYLNQDCADLKFSSKLFKEKSYPLPKKIKDKLFSNESFFANQNDSVISILKLKEKNFIVAKLIIRDTVFGFVVLDRDEKFSQDELEIMNCVCAVLAYQIKDIELSNVFKIQLKALQDGLEETHRANEVIKEQNERILEADKVKNEFLANVSHELRTPLNAIIGFSEVLSSKLFGELNERQADYIKDIHVSGLHLLGMINEILDISKIEAHAMTLNRVNFEVLRVVEEVCNIIRPLADKKDITINKEVDENIYIYADYQKISQILYNLLSNAIKFTPDFGTIKVQVSQTPKFTTIKVQDTGIGIDKKYHGKIFGKFIQLGSTMTKKESSTGLGLTITKDLVELHGGKISLQSEVDKGTTFIIKLPNINE